MMRGSEHLRFLVRLSTDGVLSYATDYQAAQPELYLNCLVGFRGYLSDKAELSRALDIADVNSVSDTYLLAAAYRRWGTQLQAHLLGEYAAFVVDLVDHSLLLTHDAVGLGQMFYAVNQQGILFATHLTDLLDLAETVDLEIDEEYLATYLARGYVTTARTPYRSIQRLLPGMSLTWAKGSFRCLRTWNLPDTKPLKHRDMQEDEEQFRTLLAAALRATVNPEGSTWVALSGGLDSSSIASMAGKLGLPNLGAYSITAPSSPHGDESMWARAVVEAHNIPWHPVDSETILPFSHLPDKFAWQAEPTSAVIHIKSHQLLDQLFAEHGVRSIMTGHGGDRLLGASSGAVSPHLVDILFAGHPIDMLHAVHDWSARHFETRSWSFLMARAVLGPAWAHLRGYRFEAGRPLPVPAWIDPDYDRRWNLMKLSRQCIATRDHSPGRQEIWDSVWAHAVSGGMAREHDGYDVRRPFLYRPFLEFMYAVPPDLRVRPRCDRYLQRRALKGVLPELVRRRGNKVFGTWAFVEGLARSRGWVEYLSDEPEMERIGITTAALWREAVQQALIGNTAGDRFFFTGVALEAWLKGRGQWRPRQRTMNCN